MSHHDLPADGPLLIVGLANPGAEYANTRHNAGAWFVQALAEREHTELRTETKFQSIYGRTKIAERDCRLLIPNTFMNHSGQAVAATAKYFKIPPAAIIVAHDDIDLVAGKVRLKSGGGHGGHNGLRDIIGRLRDQNFQRIRLGVGHPGNRNAVVDYVLSSPSKSDRQKIDNAIRDVLAVFDLALHENLAKAMQELHTVN